jgi:hypothetical protein
MDSAAGIEKRQVGTGGKDMIPEQKTITAGL